MILKETIIEEIKTKFSIKVNFDKVKRMKRKMSSILNYPKTLSVHLNRVCFFEGRMQKMETEIRYSKKLILDKHVYNLKSIVSHVGGASGGHFFTVQQNWSPLIDFNNINKCLPGGQIYQELNWAFSSDQSILKRNQVS